MCVLGEVLSAIDQIISSLICMCSGTEGADTTEGEETGIGMSAFELDENEQTGLYDLSYVWGLQYKFAGFMVTFSYH